MPTTSVRITNSTRDRLDLTGVSKGKGGGGGGPHSGLDGPHLGQTSAATRNGNLVSQIKRSARTLAKKAGLR